MISLEPIPELSALLLSAKMARIPFPEVVQAIGSAEARARTPSSDRASWKKLYGEVAATLIPQLLEAQARIDREKQGQQDQNARRQAVEKATMAVQTALQGAANEWQARLQDQESQLSAKVTRAVDALEVTSHSDKVTGELVFVFEHDALEAFWAWVRSIDEQWAANNGKLVSVRAQEAIAPALVGVSFEMKAAELRLPVLEPTKMRGERIPEPGFLQSLSSTYRTIMTAVTAVSGLGFFLSRTITLEDFGKKSLTVVSLIVFVGATIYATVTIPRERKQSMARLVARSRIALAREVVSAAKAHLSQVATSQRTQLARHIAAEITRFKSGTGVPSSGAVGVNPSPLAGGFMPADVVKLRGDWKTAIERHLATFDP